MAEPTQEGNPPPTKPPSALPGGGTGSGGLHISAEIRSWLYVGLLACIVIALIWDLPVISRLSDAGFARGLITFLISVATIGLAFILVYQAESSTTDGFRRAREIFTGLMGVLGTIVGFYFGSADKPSVPFEIAELRSADKQLITHISGGTKPYRYSITSSDNDFVAIKSKLSDDGWIIETLAQAPKPASALTIDVTDSKDQKVKRKLEIPGEAKATPTPAPQKPETPGTRPSATPTASSSPPTPTETASPAR